MAELSRVLRAGFSALAALGLSACMTTPMLPSGGVTPVSPNRDNRGVEISPVAPPSLPSAVPDARNSPPPPITNPALSALVARANVFSGKGQWELAAAELERGIRIAPQDGQVWLLLAEARFQQGQYSQAAQLARRALTLVPPNSNIAYRAQDLIARAAGN